MSNEKIDDKVVDLFAAREKKVEEKKKAQEADSFLDVAERNKKNKERIEKERLNANKSVLRSYRLK